MVAARDDGAHEVGRLTGLVESLATTVDRLGDEMRAGFDRLQDAGEQRGNRLTALETVHRQCPHATGGPHAPSIVDAADARSLEQAAEQWWRAKWARMVGLVTATAGLVVAVLKVVEAVSRWAK